MRAMTKTTAVATVTLAIALLAPADLLGCSVCFGNPDSPLSKGVNNGVLLMLGVVGVVQIGFVALFWNFRKRAKAMRKDTFHVVRGGK